MIDKHLHELKTDDVIGVEEKVALIEKALTDSAGQCSKEEAVENASDDKSIISELIRIRKTLAQS
eukprot:7428580-Karenia_brevis.AAC.1